MNETIHPLDRYLANLATLRKKAIDTAKKTGKTQDLWECYGEYRIEETLLGFRGGRKIGTAFPDGRFEL